MGRLNEEFVKIEAMICLKEHYAQKHNYTLESEKNEATVEYRGKKGRADGILTYSDPRGRVITVALEAKSRKTYSSLKPNFKDTRSFLLLFFSFVLVFILSMFAFDAMRLWLRFLVSAIISIVISLLFIIWVAASYKDTKRGVIDQLLRYPADYRWIALPVDAYNMYSNRKRDGDDDFIDHLRAKRIGLILVSGRNKSRIVLEPRTKKTSVYHKYYKRYTNLKNKE